MLDGGTAGYGVDVNFSVSAGTVTATIGLNIGCVIGSTVLESDDATVDADVVLTLFSNDGGTILDRVSGVTSHACRTGFVELTSSALTNSANPNAGIQFACWESANAVHAEDGSVKVVTTAAQSKTRVHWFAG